jgi:hypothetical protein
MPNSNPKSVSRWEAKTSGELKIAAVPQLGEATAPIEIQIVKIAGDSKGCGGSVAVAAAFSTEKRMERTWELTLGCGVYSLEANVCFPPTPPFYSLSPSGAQGHFFIIIHFSIVIVSISEGESIVIVLSLSVSVVIGQA